MYIQQTVGCIILTNCMVIFFVKRRYVLRLGVLLMLSVIVVSLKAKLFIKEKNGDNITFFFKNDALRIITTLFTLIGMILTTHKAWTKFLKQLSDMTDYN